MNREIKPEYILAFFSKNSKGLNDFYNKVRENILLNINNFPLSYFENIEYGKYWKLLSNEFNKIFKRK